MKNLNHYQEQRLALQLQARRVNEQDMIELVELYVLVRTGRGVHINLENGISHLKPSPMYVFLRTKQTELLIHAYSRALEWFGRNYQS